MRFMSPLTRRGWEPERNRYRRAWAGRLDKVGPALAANFAVQRDLVRAFHGAGMPLMTGTDAPLMFVFPGWSLHRELELLVECGLPPIAALRAATTTPARVLGVAGRTGTIAVGTEADLLLVRGDPLRDIRVTRAVAAVCVRGRWLDRASLDRGLDELAAGYGPMTDQLARLLPPLDQGDVAAVAAAFQQIAKPDPMIGRWLEDEINERGYALIRTEKTDAAITAFEINTRLFPASANVWDSLGEALAIKGDTERAIRAYRRAVELDPGNAGSREALRKLETGGEGRGSEGSGSGGKSGGKG